MSDPDTIATYEAVADEYRERHGDRSVIAEIVDPFLDALADATDRRSSLDGVGRVLDAGCGPGWESATFADAGYDVLGIDLTVEFLAVAGETAPAADFARMDMRSLGLGDSVVDGVWACASFLHVPREDAPPTLAAFERVLAEGGVLGLSVKRGDGTTRGGGYDGDERQFVLYQPPDVRGLVRDAGFTIETIEADEDWIFLLARA
jgi:SAM-dependent methyltransferase